MRKLVTFLGASVLSLAAMATDYTGNLTVSINEVNTSQQATITINENQGEYTLTLKNFILKLEGNELPVGNIVIDHVAGSTTGGVTMLYADRTIQITEGDAGQSWTGPTLPPVPIKMSARFNADGMLVTNIDIDMQETLTQTIKVAFSNTAEHFQMPNAGFEQWTDKTTEPKHWHGFKSAKGKMAKMAPSTLEKSENCHAGKYSAVIASKKIFSITANGTMTNGQLSADAFVATDPKNHSETDLSSTEADKNGDPFYTKLYAQPDYLQLWVKFSQETPNKDYPYATVSSTLTDGTYYQDPEDKAYSNVAAKAQNKEIATGDWRLIKIPFDYATYAQNKATAKAILLTVSTNATPGQGGDNDQVWIDDVELGYEANITDLKFKGETLKGWNPETSEYTINNYTQVPTAADFTATLVGRSAVMGTVIETTKEAYIARVSVVSGDLAKGRTISVKFPIKESPITKGDVNRDGKIDVNDATAAINMIVGSNKIDLEVADLNGDGKIGVSDVTAIINLFIKK